ncbi:MAG TPA: spermidine synthase [Rhodospirillaceae bacterium]|nr:spermidine synthase [Candidatus Neomarinimicrobiota bacterium]HCX15098.1 spermidine synthase [Rhodospirillaceae bacterium]
MNIRDIATILSAAFLLVACGYTDDRVIHSEKSMYRNIFVTEYDGLRCLTFRRISIQDRQTCKDLRDPDRFVFPYTRMMLGVLAMVPDPSRILIIGLGGGTLPMALRNILPNVNLDVVEIDPAVVGVARKYFGYKEDAKLRTHTEDGRIFVKKALLSGSTYDLIMLDAFEEDYIPEHLLTVEFLQEVKSLLTPGGVVAANTFSSSSLYPYESATYEAAFGPFYSLKSSNRVIWAQEGAITDQSSIAETAKSLEPYFDNHGIEVHWLLSLLSQEKDWPADSRVLTDQYAPSNILNDH